VELTAEPLESVSSFSDLGVREDLLRGLTEVGIETPTDIQTAMIPHVLAHRDVVGQARTGTGKTLAFGLPLLQQIDPDGGVQVACLAPTRELAAQIVEEINMAAKHTPLEAAAVYGGERIDTQVRRLRRNPQFIVCTPGRLLDMLGRGLLSLDKVRAVVLDEVDRMLDIGFRDDIRRILSKVNPRHQTIVVSATIDEEIRRLVLKHTVDPVWIDVSGDQITVAEVEEWYVTAESREKFRALKRLLAVEQPELAIIFTNTKGMARRLAQKLGEAGFRAAGLHGDLLQKKRERIMQRFREQDIHLLVATDVAARGIDVDDISHIINYDIPKDREVYVHRIGRTARMGRSGRAFTLVMRGEGKQLTNIEMLTNKLIPEARLDGFESRDEGQAPAPRRTPPPAPRRTPPSAPVPAERQPEPAPTEAASPAPASRGFPRSRSGRRRRW
jgi:ATP-dependent RNA helicase DeaD